MCVRVSRVLWPTLLILPFVRFRRNVRLSVLSLRRIEPARNLPTHPTVRAWCTKTSTLPTPPPFVKEKRTVVERNKLRTNQFRQKSPEVLEFCREICIDICSPRCSSAPWRQHAAPILSLPTARRAGSGARFGLIRRRVPFPSRPRLVRLPRRPCARLSRLRHAGGKTRSGGLRCRMRFAEWVV